MLATPRFLPFLQWRDWLIAAITLGYVLVLLALPQEFREAALPLTMIPTALAAGLRGMRVGMALVLVLVASHAAIYSSGNLIGVSSAIGHGALFLLAIWIGWMRSMQLRVRGQAATVDGQRRTSERQANQLAEALGSVGGARDLEAALEALLRGTVSLLGSRHGVARVVDPDTGEWILEMKLTQEGGLDIARRPGPPLPGTYGEALLGGAPPVLVRDYAGVELSGYAHRNGVLKDGFHSAVHVPIIAGGRPTGILSVNHPEPGFFGPVELALAGALAARAGDAVERARMQAIGSQMEEDRARLDGALLVARTVAHEVNNALAPVLGYAELLGLRPDLAADPAAMSHVQAIMDGASLAAEKIRRLQQIIRLEERDSVLGADRPLLDLERSTAPASRALAHAV